MTATAFKEHFREIKRGRPGHRFQDHYEHEKKARRGHRSAGRIVRLVLGTGAVIAGIIFCVIPGPGLPIIFIGGALLAAESKVVARSMDWLEVRARKIFTWAKAHWKKLPLWGKIAVALVVASAVAASLYFFWQLMHR